MDKTITTALLIIISMIMVLMLFNVAYPAITEGSDALRSMANNVSERMHYQVSIIHVSGELDNTGWWQDTNGNGVFDVFAWVKNVGDARITALDRVDVFFGPEGNFVRIPFQQEAGGVYPYWTWELENDSEWVPTATLQVSVHYQAPIASGRYFLKVILPNGVSHDYFVGL